MKSIKNLAAYVSAHRNGILKKTAIVAAGVVGLTLTAGLIGSTKVAADIVEIAPEATETVVKIVKAAKDVK